MVKNLKSPNPLAPERPHKTLLAYPAKRTKNDVKNVLSLTKKWKDIANMINDYLLLWKLTDGDMAAK